MNDAQHVRSSDPRTCPFDTVECRASHVTLQSYRGELEQHPHRGQKAQLLPRRHLESQVPSEFQVGPSHGEGRVRAKSTFSKASLGDYAGEKVT